MKFPAAVLFFTSIFLWNSAVLAQEYSAFWSLRGNSKSLERQNKIADNYGLPRIEDDAMLNDFIGKKLLVRVPADTSTFYLVNEEKFWYLRPWARDFLEKLASRHFAQFRTKLKISSLVRTRVYQERLVAKGISDADGKIRERLSAHLTGSAFDISRLPMPSAELSWMRRELIDWKKKGAVEPVEEFYNNSFHIMVSPAFGEQISAEKPPAPKQAKHRKKSR